MFLWPLWLCGYFPSLFRGALFVGRATATQDIFDSVVPFLARIFVNVIFRITRQRNFNLPGFRIRLGIIDRDLITDSVVIDARESLDNMECFALRNAFDPAARGTGCDPSLVVVVRRIDHERVSVPMGPRIAIP